MSLLGNFYERIHGSQEFLASESLNYILNCSQKTNENLVRLINHDNESNYSSIAFFSQVQGENNEIPDLSGYENTGNEVIILETKFWASLTKNQPGTYLKRLADNGVLVFICPELRTQSLKGEIINALQKENISFSDEGNKIRICKRSILVYSWKTILDAMEIDIKNSDFEIRSDILQLRGLCERIDNDSFLPITADDLSPSIPKKILSYQQIVIKVVDKLVSENVLNTDGFRKTAQAYGFTYYCGIKPLQIALEVNLELWSKYADTPIWIGLSIIGEKQRSILLDKINNEVKRKYDIKDYGSRLLLYYPFRLREGEIEEEIINSLAGFITSIIDIFRANQ